jgi:hypothetical protein
MTEFSLLIKSLDFYVDPLEEFEETISRNTATTNCLQEMAGRHEGENPMFSAQGLF